MARSHRIIPPLTMQEQHRFWSKIKVCGPEQCWLWTAHRQRRGYGTLRLRRHMFLSHRVAYFISSCQDPGNLCVLHSCDVPACCNPNHLWTGTDADNNADMICKRRDRHTALPGMRNGSSRLNDEQIRNIRKLHSSGAETQKLLAKRYGVARVTIWKIVHGLSWKHIANTRSPVPASGEKDFFPNPQTVVDAVEKLCVS